MNKQFNAEVQTRFINARKNGLALSSEIASQKLIELIPQLIHFENGSFVDMRKI